MTPNHSRFRALRPRSCRGFTITEMILVVGIIMLLMAIMLPSLSAVQKRSRKMVELNNLRQVGMAWNMYANQHNDAALPGFLEETGARSVQKSWKVRFEYPFPPDGGNGPDGLDPTIPDEISGPWTWRLAQYFDYNPEVLWGYRDEATNDVRLLVDNAHDVAYEPAFGYNAYYIGGWWRVTAGEDGGGEFGMSSVRPRHAFWDATVDGKPANVVVRSLSTMARPEELVVFSSSTRHETSGFHPGYHDGANGSHLVTPPTVAEDRMWEVPSVRAGGGGGGGNGLFSRGGGSDRHTIRSYAVPAHTPLGRHNRFSAILTGDGATDTAPVNDLDDQRRWINGLGAVQEKNFTHQGTYWP